MIPTRFPSPRETSRLAQPTPMLALCFLLAVLLCPAAPAADPPEASPAEAASIVATFRDRLHPEELNRWMLFKKSSEDPVRASEELVLLKVLAREAEALGLDQKPEVRWRLDRAELAILWPKVLQHTLSGLLIDEQDVSQLAGRLETMPRRVRLRNIFKRFPRDADDNRKAAIRARMESVVERWRQGEDFRQLAREESDSQTRWQGGLLGNVRAGTLRPAIDKIAMTMEPGQISDILEEEEGLTVLFCEKILDAVVRSPEELRTIARQRLENQREGKLTRELEDELLAESGLSFTWPDASASTEDQSGEAVVAHWLEGRLTVDELESWLKSLGPPSQGLDMPREWIERQIRTWVIHRMARLRARRLGLIDASVREPLFFSRLQALAGQALARRVSERFEPITETKMRQAYDRWIADPETEPEPVFMRPEIFELRVLQLPLETQDPRPTYELAETLSRRLQAGELDFARAAAEFSAHGSKAQGGSLGGVSMRQINRRFGFGLSRALQGLQVGEISAPVEESEALWILSLDGLEASRAMTFEEARARIEQRLGQERAEQFQQEVTDQLWSDLEARDAQGRAVD